MKLYFSLRLGNYLMKISEILSFQHMNSQRNLMKFSNFCLYSVNSVVLSEYHNDIILALVGTGRLFFLINDEEKSKSPKQQSEALRSV